MKLHGCMVLWLQHVNLNAGDSQKLPPSVSARRVTIHHPINPWYPMTICLLGIAIGLHEGSISHVIHIPCQKISRLCTYRKTSASKHGPIGIPLSLSYQDRFTGCQHYQKEFLSLIIWAFNPLEYPWYNFCTCWLHSVGWPLQVYFIVHRIIRAYPSIARFQSDAHVN